MRTRSPLLGILATLAWAAAPANAAGFDAQAIVKQIPMCKVAHGFIVSPCAGKLLSEKILPHLVPIEVSGLRATKTLIELDVNDFKSKVAGWINKGLSWIGVPESFRIPKKIGYDVEMGLVISRVAVSIPKGTEYQPQIGGDLEVRVKVLNPGLFHNKTFKVRGRLEGKVYLTVAPVGRDCTEGKTPWTMVVANLQITKLDVDKIPDFLVDSWLFLKLVNWGLQRAYLDYPEYNTKGIPICLQGNCPRPPGPAAPPPMPVTLKVTAAKRYLELTFSTEKGLRGIKISDHSLFCKVVDDVVNSGCTDQFVNHMANVLLPLRVPVPVQYAGDGLSVSADKFRMALSARNVLALFGEASLLKQGEAEKMTVSVSANLEMKPQCDVKSFMMFLRPTLNAVRVGKIPRWLIDAVVRVAVNSRLKPLDFCFATFKVPGLGKSINACKLTDALLKERCTGPLLNAIADSIFPLRVYPAQATVIRDPYLKQLMAGIWAQVSKVRIDIPPGNERQPQVSVRIDIGKQGESQKLSVGGTLGFGIDMKCGRERNALRVRPSILGIDVSPIPDWLLQSTVVTLGNATIGRWHALCVLGDCKAKQKIDVRFPFASTLPGGSQPARAAACNFDTFEGGR